MQGKISTIDNICRRGIPLSNICFLCQEAEENAGHLLLHCAYAKDIWNHSLNI